MKFIFLLETWVLDKIFKIIYSYDAFLWLKIVKNGYTWEWVFILGDEVKFVGFAVSFLIFERYMSKNLKKLSQSAAKHTTTIQHFLAENPSKVLNGQQQHKGAIFHWSRISSSLVKLFWIPSLRSSFVM